MQAPDVDDAVEELVLQDVLELGIEVDELLQLSLLLGVEDVALVVELLQDDVEVRVDLDDVFVLDWEMEVAEELEEDTVVDELLWDDDDVWLLCTDLDVLEVELEDDWIILEL